MSKIIAAIHGIMTGQTDPSWPDKFDAWMFDRDPQVKVLKKEYRAGPFPRWNCWVRDPLLARSLANELELFLTYQPAPDAPHSTPSLWIVAHSNGAVIALLTAALLIERGFPIAGLILTGAACEADLERNGVLEWHGRGMLGAAFAYCSEQDQILPVAINASRPSNERISVWSRMQQWVWSQLVWPYGGLGRSGWTLDGETLGELDPPLPDIQSRWYCGGHTTYFTPQNIARTFEQIYQDISECEIGRQTEIRIGSGK